MKAEKHQFSQSAVDYYFDGSISKLDALTEKKSTIILTDEHVFAAHGKKMKGWNVISLKPGEAFKVQATVDAVIDTLINMGADRKTTLVGIGGGVITDLTGYIASNYMRGIRFGFAPSTVLAMVDAAIGGKNGIDVGEYKNMVGTIRQPAFLLYDHKLLDTLPDNIWSDGFAEIIKHACIRDAKAFTMLEQTDLKKLKRDRKALMALIRRNALLKTKVVKQDEFESGDRKLLNFGHTLGHAIETQYEISHGQAISIGMVYASIISEQVLGFQDKEKLIALLQQYGLPVDASFDMKKVLKILKMDKKRTLNQISYILLKKIGKGVIYPMELSLLEAALIKLNKK